MYLFNHLTVKTLLKDISVEHWFLAAILLLTFLMRFPSLFEPFWYGDEGIFAAVARNLNFGGVLYQTAWDNKPPMVYLTYAAIFKFLGVSMFSLRLVTIVVVLATTTVVYEIAHSIYSARRALIAAFIFGFLSSLRIVEGNLALTEIYMILPITLAMLMVIKRKFDSVSLFGAGMLLAIASLYKQVGAFEAVAVGIFLFLSAKKLGDFIKKGSMLTLGLAIPFAITIVYFAAKNLAGEYIFAAYTYYRIYLGESPKFSLLVNILKFMPIVAAIVYGLYKSSWRFDFKTHPFGVSHLILLWMAFSFLGSYFSGRTYGHYMIQAIPAVSLLAASINLKAKFKRAQILFAILFFVPLVFLTKLLFTDFLSGGPVNQVKYWRNFVEFAAGAKGVNAYNDFFDRNVNSIMALSDFFNTVDKKDRTAYIWGDFPWLYAIADLANPVRYVTSFHVFGTPNGKGEVVNSLINNPPTYIIKPERSIGYFVELESILISGYTLVAKIENSEVFVKSNAQ